MVAYCGLALKVLRCVSCVLDNWLWIVLVLRMQYHQWFRSAAEARAPELPRARIDSATYSTDVYACDGVYTKKTNVLRGHFDGQAGNLAMFHQQLAYCTTQFVEKDPQTSEPIILGLLKFWPVTASAKEVPCALLWQFAPLGVQAD